MSFSLSKWWRRLQAMDIRELDFSVRITLVLFLNRPFPVSFPFISCRFFHAILYRKKSIDFSGIRTKVVSEEWRLPLIIDTWPFLRVILFQNKYLPFWTVVVAQLVERLLLMPEVRSSNPVTGSFYLTVCCIVKILARNGNIKYFFFKMVKAYFPSKQNKIDHCKKKMAKIVITLP